MNTTTKLSILFALLIAFLFVSAVPASANTFFSKAHTVQGSKVNSHIEVKPGQSCRNWTENGWIVELSYYTQPELDGSVTSSDVAYSDYLSDYGQYFEQYAGTCYVAPEALN